MWGLWLSLALHLILQWLCVFCFCIEIQRQERGAPNTNIVWRWWWVHWDVGDILFIKTLKVLMCKCLLQHWTVYRSLGLLNCWAVKNPNHPPLKNWGKKLDSLASQKRNCGLYWQIMFNKKGGNPIITLIVKKKLKITFLVFKQTHWVNTT